MIGIITVGDQAMADRYAYIPFIGLFIAIVWCLAAFIAEHRIPAPWPGVAGALVVLILGCLTYRQLGYWRDDETLWRYTLSVTDRNYVAHDNLARVLAEEGRSNEAVVEFRAAEALHPYPLSQVLALALYELRVGHPQEAIEDCDSVLRVFTGSKNEDSQHKDAQNKDSHKDARNEDARSSLSPQNDTQLQSTAWSELGQAQMQLRDYEQSGNSFLNALRLNPENGGALVGSGLLALRHGRSAGAVGDLTLAVKVDSSDVNWLLLAHALRLAGNAPAANSALLQASKISADMRQAQIAAEQVLALAGLNP
jgi:protein O-mannosyl-transferase